MRDTGQTRRGGVATEWLKNVDTVIPHFRDVMLGSRNIEVCPEACIPFTNIRPRVRSGIIKLKAILDATATFEDGVGGGGISLGSKKTNGCRIGRTS